MLFSAQNYWERFMKKVSFYTYISVQLTYFYIAYIALGYRVIISVYMFVLGVRVCESQLPYRTHSVCLSLGSS